MTGYGDYALTWFKIGLLGSYSKTGDTHTFTYDMDGRRLSRTDNGTTTTFVYAGDQLVGQTWGGNTLAFILDAAGDYIGFTYNGTDYYYVKNLQGDVVQIVNAAKTTVVKYYYDAWGYNFATEGSLASTVGAVNPIRYRGYYYDTGTGLYFLQSRYYDPSIRRFISPDKLLDTQSFDGFNLFAYCGNNPVCGVDRFGYSYVLMDFSEYEYAPVEKQKGIFNALKANLGFSIDYVKAFLGAIEISVGGGIGIGAKALIATGSEIEIDVCLSSTDALVVSDLSIDVKNTTGLSAGISIFGNDVFLYNNAVEHSFFDSQCTCSFWEDPIADRYKCPAAKHVEDQYGFGIGFSGGLYLGVGGEFSVFLDAIKWDINTSAVDKKVSEFYNNWRPW